MAWPRSAMIPPPGRPMLPSSSCRIAPRGCICTPRECCVQPTRVAERRRALAARSCRSARSATSWKSAARDAADLARPSRACSARSAGAGSGSTQRGCCSVSSRSERRRSRMPAPVFSENAWRGVLALPAADGDLAALVHPRRAVVGLGLGVEAGEEAVEVLGVAELLVDDRRGVGVVEDVLLEVGVGLQHVADQRRRGTRCRCPARIGTCRSPTRPCARSAGRRG